MPADNDTQEPTQEAPVFNAELISACDAIVAAYRTGSTGKAEATLDLLERLDLSGAVEAADREARRNSYRTYLGRLDEVDARGRESHARGERATGGPDPEPDAEQTRPSIEVRATPADPPPFEGEEDSDGELNSHKRKRSLSPERKTPKVPVDESLLPFMPGNRVALALAGKSTLEATLYLKENYIRDVALVKQRIVCRPNCPEVPETIWGNVIKNAFVDLDVLFTAIFSIDGDGKDTIQLGDVELSTVSTKPIKKVANQGSWISCFTRYHEAVVFVYPNRDSELRQYFTYINDTFVGIQARDVPNVIRFERASRSAVARGNQSLLTDFYKHQHLHVMYLHPSGAGAETAAPRAQGNRGSGRSNDACNKFNDGRCNNRDCRYRHICRGCGSVSHALVDCPSKAGGSSDGKRK